MNRAAVEFRQLPAVEPLRAQQTIDRIGRLQNAKLALRIGPGVFLGVRKEHRPRRTQCHQAILVEGQALDLIVEFLEFVAEPVRKTIVDLLDLFPHVVPAGGRPAAAGLVRNDQRDPLVERAGQKGGLPSRECPTTAIRDLSISLSVTR